MSDVKVCAVDDCTEPRKTYPKSPPSRFCPAHESARVQKMKERRVTDPVTGREVAAGSLAWYTWDRKRKAAMAEGQ